MYTSRYADEKRSCTDCFCLVIFIALTVFMLGVAVYAWTNSSGNFQKLTTAYDSDGKGCGVDYPKYPYIYFASPHADVFEIGYSHSGSRSASQNVQWKATHS
jgi:hypothetical protein